MDGKRPREDDPEQEFKRQHVDPTAELISNVCKDIRRIGENGNLANQIDDISYISNPIVVEFEQIDKLRVSILNTLNALILEQPQKISALSALVLICNSKNFLVSKYVIEFFHNKIQTSLSQLDSDEDKSSEDAGSFNNIKSILKFLSCLSPIIENYAIINIYKQFLSLAIELQNKSESRNGLAEEIFYNTLMALPYLLSNDVSDEMIKHCNELVELAQTFQIKKDSDNLDLYHHFVSQNNNFNVPYTPKAIIDLILPSLLDLQTENKDWANLKGKLFIGYTELIAPIVEQALQSNKISNEIVKHPLPQFNLPSVEQLSSYTPTGIIDTIWSKYPRVLFEVYNNIKTEFETVPSIESYIGLFFKDLSFDILTNLSFNKTEGSIQLSILDLFFNRDLFSPPGTSVDQLEMIHRDNASGENVPPLSTWKIEEIAVESILTMIFQLPKPLHHEIYYYTVLISCCKENPESIAPVFGRAIRFFYNNLETLDLECKIKFLDWMTIQISNFEFSWKWDEWVGDARKLKNLTYHPKINFIKNLILKEVKLSKKERIKDSFIAMNPEDPNSVLQLEDLYRFLNISLFKNESKYIINYDSKLFGNNGNVKELIAKLSFDRKENFENKFNISPQQEMLYLFLNPELPLFKTCEGAYQFLLANNKLNKEFFEFVESFKEAIDDELNINKQEFIINFFFQTYCYIGQRSIYSTISILNRDLNKLRFLAGVNIADEDYINYNEEFKFPHNSLSPEEFGAVQGTVVDAIFRIWVHQPQFAFLILEYLVESRVVYPVHLVRKCLSLDTNLLIDNVTCFESIERVLESLSGTEQFKEVALELFGVIVSNLNSILKTLEIADDAKIEIVKDFTDEQAEDLELMGKIDNQWLYFQYVGLFKSLLRRYEDNALIVGDIENLLDVPNTGLKQELANYVSQIKK